MRRLAIVFVLTLLGFGASGLASHVSATPVGPDCYDYRDGTTHVATKWLTSSGTLNGTPGADVLVGSPGTDVINGLGGNDIICGAPAFVLTFYDTISGGSGNDYIESIGNLHGNSGNDWVLAYADGAIAYGDSGNDYVRADSGAIADGGSGNDTVVSNYSVADQLLGGSGEDFVDNETGANFIDCGANVDTVHAGNVPPANVKHCQKTAP